MILRVGAECSGKLSLSLPPAKGVGIQLAVNYRCRSDRPREREIEVPAAVLVPPATVSDTPPRQRAMALKSLGNSIIATVYYRAASDLGTYLCKILEKSSGGTQMARAVSERCGADH